MVQSIYRQIAYLYPVVDDWAHTQVKTLVLGHVAHIQVPDVFNGELLKFLMSDNIPRP